MSYPREYRDTLVRRMIGPAGLSAHQVSRDTGIPRQTLCRWRINALRVEWMERHKDEPEAGPLKLRPQDWTAQEKLRVVLEAASLDEAELGVFLRTEGVHEAQLDEWREHALSGALTALGAKHRRKGARSARERELERELARKEKALAEAAALLILRGKLQALSEGEGDDTTGS